MKRMTKSTRNRIETEASYKSLVLHERVLTELGRVRSLPGTQELFSGLGRCSVTLCHGCITGSLGSVVLGFDGGRRFEVFSVQGHMRIKELTPEKRELPTSLED